MNPENQSAMPASLAECMGEEPGEVSRLLPAFIRIVSRLIQIHSEGQTPRGLSPRLIRLAPNGDVGIDAAPAGPQQSTVITEPKYSSPEMFREQSTDGGAQDRSDIYVTGFVFYELLAGRRLFEQEFSALGRDPNAMQWLRWQGDVQKGLRPLTALEPRFSKPLSDLVARMTEKDPARRPKDLAEVLESLIAISRGLVITQRFQTAGAAAAAQHRRRRLALPVLAVTALLAAVFVWSPFGRDALARARALITSWGGGADRSAPRTSTADMILISESSPGGPLRFYVDRHEVDNWTYKQFCDETRRPYPAAQARDPDYFSKPEYPVRNISGEDFAAFARWAGKRLPSDAEAKAVVRRLSLKRFPWEPDGQLDDEADSGEPQSRPISGYRCAADADAIPGH